jgi:hypothetical protein
MSYNACKSCGHRIQWAQHEKTGSWMIFDTDKQPTGEAELRWIIEPSAMSGTPTAKRAEVGEVGVLDHHATCEKVDDWRNGKRRGSVTS